jgi:hypothetical protein
MKKALLDYLLARLAEPSTWSGIALLLTSFGVQLSPEQTAAIVSTGLAVTGLIGTFLPERNLTTAFRGIRVLARRIGRS